MSPLPLRAALTRGAMVTAANWPVVLIEFVLDVFLKLALTVPVIGGALMVATLVETDLQTVLAEGLRSTADLVIGSLVSRPIALTSFLAAVAIVGLGGGPVIFAIKAGTLAVLTATERATGDLSRGWLDWQAFRRATAYSLSNVMEGTRTFGRRASVLALWLGAAYLVLASVYLVLIRAGLALAMEGGWAPAWPALVFVATSSGVIVIGLANLVHDLLRVVVVAENCGLRVAARRLGQFVLADSRQVIGIFCVIGGIQIVTTTAALLAAAGLGVMAWLPVIGLAFLPLQAGAWLARGLLLQYMALSALVAYQTQYRRFAVARWGASGEDGQARVAYRVVDGAGGGAWRR